MCIQVCQHEERECCVRALVNQLRVDNRDRMQVQMAHTSVALDKTNASADSAVFHTPRAVAMNGAKGKQFELWQFDECDLRIKAWEAREIQLEVRVGAKRECLSKLVARLKHDRIDDNAEDERDEEVLRDCLFPQYYANPGVSPLRRRTKRGARRDSCAIVSSRQLDDG